MARSAFSRLASLGSSATVVMGALMLASTVAEAQASNLPLVTDLTGSGWTIKNGNGSISVDASVPVYALEALHQAKKVPDPLDR